MTARFTVEALEHAAQIHSFIATHNVRAAAHVVARIFAEIDRLTDFPRLGHAGEVLGTFERTVPGLPYIIVYQLDRPPHLTVLGIFHGARKR